MQNDKMKSNYGFYQVLYQNLRLYSPGARFYYLIFMLRRALLVLMIFKA